MNLFIIGIAIAVLVVIATSATSARRKRKFKKAVSEGLGRYKRLVEIWVKEVEEASSDNELSVLAHRKPGTENLFKNLGFSWDNRDRLRRAVKYPAEKVWRTAQHQQAIRKVEAAQRRIGSPERSVQLTYEKAKKASGVSDELEALFSLLSNRDDVLSSIGLTQPQIRLWIKKSYLEALKKARSGDRGEFLELRAFFGASKEYHRRKPINGRPEDWAELVVRYLEAPDIGDFTEARYSHQMPQTGELRLMAAEALRTKSLVQSQEVLAYCNHSGKYQSEVGDRLLAELAKLVDRLQTEALNKKEVLYR